MFGMDCRNTFPWIKNNFGPSRGGQGGSKGGLKANKQFLPKNVIRMSNVLCFQVWNHEYRLRVYVFNGKNIFGPPRAPPGGPPRVAKVKISIVRAMFWIFSVWNHEYRLRVCVFKGKNICGPPGAPLRGPKGRQGENIDCTSNVLDFFCLESWV